MTSTSTPRAMSAIGKRLLIIFAIVTLTCVLISVLLQPTNTSAQEPGETPAPVSTVRHEDSISSDKEATITPTPTPGISWSTSRQAARAANSPSRADGIGVIKPRGLFSLTAAFYADTDFTNLVYTTLYSSPIDFSQVCESAESPLYPGCKLVEQQPQGISYTVRWSGKILVPEGGNYTFILDRVDDEARLFIDGNEVVQAEWDGATCFHQHVYASQVKTFATAGVHNIVVEYRQCPSAYAELQVRWSGPAFSNEVIPVLTAPPECDCELRQSSCCEGEVGGPINTRTGNYDYTQQDISISALGEALHFKRTYNSLREGDPALGNGWTHNYNLQLRADPGALIIRTCQGQEFTFLGDPSAVSGDYRGAPGVAGTLTRTGTYGGYTYYLTTASNERYTFNADGQPTEIQDAQGHTTTLTYSGTQLIRVADATDQRYLNFTYDLAGHLVQISDPLSRTIGYGYDAAGNLSVMTDTLGQTWTYSYTGTLLQEIRNPANEVVERTEFDEQRRAVRQWSGTQLAVELQYLEIVDEWGLPAPVTIMTNVLGQATLDTYNSRGTLVEQTETAVSTDRIYDYNFHLTEQTDRNGNPTSFIYNSMGRPLAITDALGSATQLKYDPQNHLTQLTDAAGSRSYYTYTGNLLTAQSDALGLTTIYTYNPQNLLAVQQDAQGRVTEYAYNLWGQRTAVTTTEGVMHYEYDQVGRLITTTDTFDRVTVNVYDHADRLLAVTRNYLAGQGPNYLQAYNLTTAYEYDLAGRQIAITDTLNRVTRNVHDENGQLIKTIVNYDPAREQNELNQYNITTEYGYDAARHQILVTDTLGHVSRTDYDVQSRPVTMTTNYLDGAYDPAHPDEDIMRVTQYDLAGNAIAQIDPLGRVTRTWYDAVNRVVSTTNNYDPTRPQNDQGEFNLVTSYGYDETGNRILIIDTLGRVARTYYDATGRLISTTANYLPGHEPNHLNQYNLNTFYGYDGSGRQYLVTNTLGLANHTAYDPVTGRPLTTTTNYTDGVFDPTRPDEDVAQSTEYDVHGNPYLRRDAAGRATRTWYDELNRVISVTHNYAPDRPQNDESQYNLVTTYSYDEVGNRAWVTDTAGRATWTQYDALNRAVTVTQNYLPGQPVNYQGQYNLVTTYEHDALGRQIATIDPAGRRTSSEFDQVGRTIAQINPLEQRMEYAYDVLGNRTVLTDAAQHVTRFEYDTLNRLITTTRYLADDPIVEVTHYDAAGNRVEAIDARGHATAYGYDALGHTIAITDANLHVTTFAYDALGRRTAQTDALQHTTVYTPDRLGRQIALADPLGNSTQSGYDVIGNRVVMTDANNLVTRYEYDLLDRLSVVLENYTGGPQTTDRDVRTSYAYDPLGNRTVMTNARGYTMTYEYDALNRMSRMQDARGQSTAYVYEAIGNRTVLTDANGEVTLFAYDDLNRQTTLHYLADATSVEYAYDARGNRTAMTDTLGTTHYVVDDLNRLTSVTDPFAQTVSYTYDAAGNRTNVIYPDGQVVTYTYDAAGLLTGVIDWDGQATAYAYDAANRLVTVTLPPSGSIQTVYTYDNANRLIHLTHTRLSDHTLLADYEFTLDKMGNRLQVIEAMEYPEDSQVTALPRTPPTPWWGVGQGVPSPLAVPTLADAIVEAITGHRAPGLSGPVITGTLAMQDTLTALGAEQRDASGSLAPLTTHELPSHRTASEAIPPASNEIAHRTYAARSAAQVSPPAVTRHNVALAPLAGPGDIFADSFESGDFTAWSAAVTNSGNLSVTTSAKRWGNYGMQAQIVTTTAMYVRNDTPNAETRYRARFYFHPNSISMASGNAHYLFTGRTGSIDVLRLEFRYSTPNYQVRAQLRNDSTAYSSSSWYTISNAWHAIEIDWQAATAAGANNGYITLWIDGVQKQTVGSIDNDTRRVDEARLGPLNGIDSGTNGTEYFDAFESRRDTYIGPVALADFSANPLSGSIPLTVTFTNASQPTDTLTSYLWDFGDGYTDTITNPVHSYSALDYYTVTLTAWNGTWQDTLTKTQLITVTPYADFTGSPTTGRAPLAVTFSNASQPANEITSYLWNFGDGVTSTQTNPEYTYTAAGEYTVTLTASAGSGSNTVVRPQYITVAPGLGDPAALAEDPSANEGTPAIAYNSLDLEYLVVWRAYTDQHDVSAHRVLSDGTPIGSPIAIAAGSGDQYDPQVAYGGGVYLVAWYEGSSSSIQAQVVQAGGALSGTAFTVSSDTGNDSPAIDYNPETNEFLVVWVHDNEGDADIHARRVSPDGQVVGSEISVTEWGWHELQPAVAHDAAGDYLVLFLCPDSSDFGLCGQRLSDTGSLLGALFSVFDGDSSTSNLPALAYDPLGDSYVVAWREAAGAASDEIWVQAVSGHGTVLGEAHALGAQTADPYGPAIACRAGNMAYVVVWPDSRNSNWDVYGRVIDSDGTPLGVMSSIETTAADQVEVAISPRGANGELLIAYNDNRSSSPDIYIERYDATGANFVAAPRSGIAPVTVIFTDTSTALQPITNWLWTFGDGLTSTLQHPTHTYSTIGYFTVTLETWADAVHDTTVKPQYLAATPHADFTAEPEQGATPLVVAFNNTSQPTAGITGYAWDFGDGFTTTTASPVHTYTAYGLYTVTLTAFSAGGAHTLVRPTAVNAWPGRGERVPIATQWWTNEERSAIAYNPAAEEYLAVWDEWDSGYDIQARRILSTGLPSGESFVVFAGDGEQYLARVAYGAEVYLVVWQDDQTSAVRGQVIQASGVLSGTDFPIGTGGADNNSPAIDFNPVTQEFLVTWARDNTGDNDVWAQRIAPSGQLIGSAVFVTSSGGQQLQPASAHDQAGNYLVVYLCPDTGDFGICGQRLSGTGTLSGTVISIYATSANSVMPDLAYNPQRKEYLVIWRDERTGASDEIDAQRVRSDGTLLGSEFSIAGQSDAPYPPAVAYHAAVQAYIVVWNHYSDVSGWEIQSRAVWADGSGLDTWLGVVTAEGAQVYPALSKQGPGNDLYVLYTDHASGYPDLYGQRYLPRLADFTAAPDSGYAPLSVQFHDRSTISPFDTRQWDFGDGVNSTLPDPVHVYPQPGDYTTILTITASGQTYRTEQTIQVADPLGVQFTATPVSGTAPLTVTFADQSTVLEGVIRSWTWDFGDGITSTVQHPVHLYARAGTYDVQLIVHTDTYTKTLSKAAYIFASPPHRTVIDYTYDGLYRLTKADSTGAMTTTFEYAYDAVGNRTTQTATIASTQVTAYQYDAANRLISVNGQSYTWDDNGNLVSDGEKTYTYNQANRLTDLTQGAMTFQFNYNGDGVRLQQVNSGVPTTYTQDLAAPLPVVLQSETDESAMQYVYALGTRPLAQHGTAWEYLLADALGSVRQIVDANGNVTLAESYEPYGTVLTSTGTASSIFAYAGEQIDTSELVYLRARYMQPTLGIFLARDPWSGDALRPGSMNGWNYAEGNPILFIDPSGRVTWDFRVHLSDADVPSMRDDRVLDFRNKYWNFFGDFNGALGREADFINWMQESGRLVNGYQNNWWDVVDAYLTASRFAGERVADYLKQKCPDPAADALLGQLEPGVAAWAAIILSTEEVERDPLLGIRIPRYSDELAQVFWLAHNSALREGVNRADARQLRSSEPVPERIVINYVLYNVLEPGDQCASGNPTYCALTLPIELKIGVSLAYPWRYRAEPMDVWNLRGFFGIGWSCVGSGLCNPLGILSGLRPPSTAIHLIDPSIGWNGF